jgi:hypothetical protein
MLRNRSKNWQKKGAKKRKVNDGRSFCVSNSFKEIEQNETKISIVFHGTQCLKESPVM